MLRTYQLLLYLYPASFRAEYGEELRRDVARRRRDVTGTAAVIAFWIAAIADVVNNASRLHWDVLRQDLHYTRSRDHPTARSLKSPEIAHVADALIG